jgi:hypothetical protein
MQPIQPLYLTDVGTIRFKGNKLVQYLLDHGNIDLNDLAVVDFPQEDRIQFAQLIGYSLSGFGELSYVTDDAYEAANNKYALGITDEQARIIALEEKLSEVRKLLKVLVPKVFNIHPDDLEA